MSCPHCGAEVAAEEAFCEACGGALTPTRGRAELEAPIEMAAPIDLTRSVQTEAEDHDAVVAARPCANCGGVVGADGYCETCGTKAPTERDHYTEQPAPWVAACCDRGIRHHRNEDATAIAAEPEPGSRAVLVVCDGVSTSLDSDVASLAAAERPATLWSHTSRPGLGTPASRVAAIANAVVKAAAAGQCRRDRQHRSGQRQRRVLHVRRGRARGRPRGLRQRRRQPDLLDPRPWLERGAR